MTWTSVPKPGAQTYTTVNAMGKEQYDQTTLTYDDANTFYDGINPNQWTDIAKPRGAGTIFAGMATGLVMPPTYTRQVTIDTWAKVPKPN